MRSAFLVLLISAAGAGSYLLLRPSSAGVATAAPSALVSREDDRARPGPVPSRRASAVQLRLDTTVYPVAGTTEAAILAALLDGGPSDGDREYFGLTEVEIDLRYRSDASDGDCALVDVEATLGVTTTLPGWDAPAEAPSALRRDWRQFLRALERHEDGHHDLALRGAEKVQRAVTGLRRPTCPEAEAEARHRLGRIETEIQGSHRLYDEETGHGRTQGAVWPLSSEHRGP